MDGGAWAVTANLFWLSMISDFVPTGLSRFRLP